MENSNPRVSIGMPVYNGERFIREALDSLLTQDYKNLELIISDNASTDRTQEICLEYEREDERIRYYRNERNMGPIWNFNRVFELSSADYFMWTCYDDYWKPNYLRICLEAFEISDAVILAGAVCKSIDLETGELFFIDQGLSTVGLSPHERFMRYKSTVHSGRHIGGIFYGIYKRSALCKVMPMKKVIASDHLILAELCFQGEFMTVQEALMIKRFGGVSASFKDMASALGINNRFFIKCPYFVREILLQRIIFRTDRLTLLEKIRLACWSLINYVRIHRLSVLLQGLPTWVKCPARRARKLWRSLAQGKLGAGSCTEYRPIDADKPS